MVEKLRRKSDEVAKSFKDGQEKGAREDVLEELFHDMYKNRHRIYKVNFFRGIFFGAGSAAGGTVVIAIAIWLLSLFVNFPLIGEFFKNAQNTIEQSQQNHSE
jgi:hypothetical protein